jgi:hypothetical protein
VTASQYTTLHRQATKASCICAIGTDIPVNRPPHSMLSATFFSDAMFEVCVMIVCGCCFLVTVVSRKLIAMTLRIGDKGPLALPLHTNLLRFPLWVVHEFEQQHCASRRSWQNVWDHGSDDDLAQVMKSEAGKTRSITQHVVQ